MTDKQKTAPEKKPVKIATEAAPAETIKPKPAKAAKVETVEVVEAAPKAEKMEAKPAPKPKRAEAEAPAEPAPAPAPVAPPVVMHGGIPAGPMRPLSPPRAPAKAENFVAGDHVVYPTHGVGKVDRIGVEEIAGHTLELICITFDENRMTLRVPTNKARTAGLRKLASKKQFDDVLAVLKGRARIKRTMWSRRAQEYEAKINSGDPAAIAEVVRDLHRNAGQPDQSFSERQIYESALDRLAAEYAALEQLEKPAAIEKLIAHLKSE
jgi:CarD family transcriptional regulator